MSTPKEIGHLVLNVTDVERSTKFYRDVVGFQVSRFRPDGTSAFLTCGIVHHNLALFKAPADARPAQKGAIGLNHSRHGTVYSFAAASDCPFEIRAACFPRGRAIEGFTGFLLVTASVANTSNSSG